MGTVYRGRVTGYGNTDQGWRATTVPDWSLGALVALRTNEVARRASREATGSLSLPTHADGSIAPEVLEARLLEIPRTAKPWPLEVGLAALRLRPAAYDTISLPSAHRIAVALRQHLGVLRRHRSEWERTIGTSQGRWHFHKSEETLVTWRDRTSRPGSADDIVAAVLDRHDPLARMRLELEDGEYVNRYEQIVAMWPLMLPHHPELLAAHAHARLNRGLDKNRAASEPLLDALARSRTVTGPVTCSALALGLSAKSGGERTRAADAVIDLARAGRLDGAELGLQSAALLEAGIIIGQRLAQTLGEASRVDQAAGSASLAALERLLPALPGRREAHHFVDLTARLAREQGRTLTLPPASAELAAGRSTSVLAKACRRVP